MKSPEEVNMVLEESHDISPFIPLDSPPIKIDIQHVISLKQHVEFLNLSPLTHDECHIRHHDDLLKK